MIALPWKKLCANFILPCGENHYGFFLRCPTSFYNQPLDKNELIEKIAGNTGLTKKDVGIVINTFIVTVTKALVEGSKVQLLGFGVFGTRERNARKVRNPRTGESIDLAASTVPYFKPGKILRDVVKSINHPI